MDWNNNGKIDAEDIILTEMILEDDSSEDNKKPTGCCGPTVAMFLLVLASPVIIATAIIHFI